LQSAGSTNGQVFFRWHACERVLEHDLAVIPVADAQVIAMV
jgi:hypothetical protein